jgi:DNA-binding GntR family transcriptional regulator
MLAERSDRRLQADRAYTELVNRLTSLEIAPGSPIDEALLADELAISRTSIREAMRRLAADRLVTTYPKRGTFASTIGITDLSGICEVRSALEGHAAQRAAERYAVIDQATLRRLRRDLARDHYSVQPQQRLELYAQVHRFLYHATANPYMEETMSRYLNLSLRIWRHVTMRLPGHCTPLDDHDSVLAAIAGGHSARGRDLQIRHIATFEEVVRAAL